MKEDLNEDRQSVVEEAIPASLYEQLTELMGRFDDLAAKAEAELSPPGNDNSPKPDTPQPG